MRDQSELTSQEMAGLENMFLPQGKNKAERTLDHLLFGTQQTNSVFMTFLLSIMRLPLLEQLAPVLFKVAFGLEAAIWAFLTATFAISSRKNLPKILGWIAGTVAIVGVGLAVFGAAVLGATAGPIIFAGVVGLHLLRNLYNIAESIKKLSIAKTEKEKAAARTARNWTIGGAVTSSLIMGALFTCLIFAPHVAFVIGLTVGIIAATVVLFMTVASIVNYIKHVKAGDDILDSIEMEDQSEETSALTESNSDDLTNTNTNANENKVEEKQNLVQQEVFLDGRLNYTPSTVEKLLDAFYINLRSHHLMKNTRFFCENYDHPARLADNDSQKTEISSLDKDENKRAALNFLEEFVSRFPEILAATPKNDSNGLDDSSNQLIYKFKIDGVEFSYRNITQLTHKIDAHIVDKYPGAFQSAFTGYWDRPEYGKVQSRFREAYQILIASHKILKTDPTQHKTLENKFTTAKATHANNVKELRTTQAKNQNNRLQGEISNTKLKVV